MICFDNGIFVIFILVIISFMYLIWRCAEQFYEQPVITSGEPLIKEKIVYKDKIIKTPVIKEKTIIKEKPVIREKIVYKDCPKDCSTKKIIIKDESHDISNDMPIVARDPVADVDVAKLSDPLIDPTRRVPRDMLTIPYLHQVATRGFPDTYQQLGVLVRTHPPTDKTDERMLPLFGRQKYPRSTQYDYYAITPKTNIKIQIFSKNNTELFNDDTIFINELNGSYKVSLYKMETLEYNPYII